MDPAIPINLSALVAVIIIGVATPLVTALLTKADANPTVKSLVAGVTAGAGTVTAYLLDVDGVPDWEHALGLFVLALATAVAFRNVDPGVESTVKDVTGHRGLG